MSFTELITNPPAPRSSLDRETLLRCEAYSCPNGRVELNPSRTSFVCEFHRLARPSAWTEVTSRINRYRFLYRIYLQMETRRDRHGKQLLPWAFTDDEIADINRTLEAHGLYDLFVTRERKTYYPLPDYPVQRPEHPDDYRQRVHEKLLELIVPPELRKETSPVNTASSTKTPNTAETSEVEPFPFDEDFPL